MQGTRLFRIVTLGLTFALGACASYEGRGLRPGIDSEPQVRALMGEPAKVWREADGGSTLEYPHGPYGRETYMVHLGPDGKLQTIEQALNESNFARLQIGKTTEDEVRHILGRPGEVTAYDRRNEHDWFYRYRNGSINMLLYVTFDDRGMVRNVAEVLDPADRGVGD